MADKRCRILIPIALVLFSGCATTSFTVSQFIDRTDKELSLLSEAQALEKTKPEEARKRYELLVASSTVPNKPLLFYQHQLEEEIKVMGQAEYQTLSEDSSFGLLPIYQKGLKEVVEARQGLARIALSGGDWSEAAAQAKKALVLVEKYPVSAVFRAEEDVVSGGLLQEAFEHQGKARSVWNCKLNIALSKEYLSSPKSASVRDEIRRMGAETVSQIKMLDDFIKEVNSSRRAAFQSRLGQAMGAVSAASSNFMQYQINSSMARSGGRMTTGIQNLQATKMVMDFQSQLLAVNPSFRQGMALGASVTNPFANVTSVQQLVNPDYGAKVPEIIKAFSQAAVQLGADQRTADLVSKSVDGITAARSGNPEEMNHALAEFGNAFGSLEKQVEPSEPSAQNP